jgi:hypothetical protein
MSADKRSTHTDALATLGTIITDGGRDAIHLAVEPVEAGERLVPGQHIGVKNGKAYSNLDAAYAHADKHVGIVDPFIKGFVMPGEKFWLIVYPRQITSLRHVWEHPDFAVDVEKVVEPIGEIVFKPAVTIKTEGKTAVQVAEEWLRAYADEIDELYEYVMEVADSHQKDRDGHYPDYIIQGGRFEGESTPDEFWDNYAIVRGVKSPVRASFFSCSC